MTFMDAPKFRRHEQMRSHQTHCHAGHPLTPQNVRKEVCTRHGKTYVMRICKACERARHRKKQG